MPRVELGVKLVQALEQPGVAGPGDIGAPPLGPGRHVRVHREADEGSLRGEPRRAAHSRPSPFDDGAQYLVGRVAVAAMKPEDAAGRARHQHARIRVQRDGHVGGKAQRAEPRLQLQESELELLGHGVRCLANRSTLAGTNRPVALSQWRCRTSVASGSTRTTLKAAARCPRVRPVWVLAVLTTTRPSS